MKWTEKNGENKGEPAEMRDREREKKSEAQEWSERMIKSTNNRIYCTRSHTCNARNLFNSRKLYKRSKNKYSTAINKTQSRIDKCVEASKRWIHIRQEKKTQTKYTREPNSKPRKKMNADGLRELCVNIRILKPLVEWNLKRRFFQKDNDALSGSNLP